MEDNNYENQLLKLWKKVHMFFAECAMDLLGSVGLDMKR